MGNFVKKIIEEVEKPTSCCATNDQYISEQQENEAVSTEERDDIIKDLHALKRAIDDIICRITIANPEFF